jgi:hypothetical protein
MRVLLGVSTLYILAIGIAALNGETDDVLGTCLGGAVLIWFLFCWRAARLNWTILTSRSLKTVRDKKE